MKKFIIALIFSVSALSVVSCKRDFLEPWPPDAARTSEDVWGFYKYAKGFLEGLVVDHQAAPRVCDIYGSYGMLGAATDEMEHSLPTAGVQKFTNGVWNPANLPTFYYRTGYISITSRSPYYNAYMAIRKANIFLENVNNSVLIDDLNDPTRRYERTYFKGQAYFYRAYYQFDILQKYGPYVISTSIEDLSSEELTRGRNTMDECVAQIVKDCNSAIDSLPVLWDEENWGRPNAVSAAAVKSRVLLYYASPLYQGDFKKFGLNKGEVGDVQRWINAADAAREAINMTDFYDLPAMTKNAQPYSTEGNYGYEIGLRTGTENKEFIYGTIQTTTGSIYNEVYNLPAGVDGCYGYNNPTQNFVDMFEYIEGSGSSRKAVPFDWDNPEHVKNMYNVNRRDPRLFNSVLYNGCKWGETSSRQYTIDMYDAVEGHNTYGAHRNPNLKNSTKTGYYYRKFLSEKVYSYKSGNYTSAKRGRILYRFAELLLNYAEALNEAYGPYEEDPNGLIDRMINENEEIVSSAAGVINLIRGRVGMPSVGGGLNKEQMREIIHHERAIELCFEGHRFYDLRRWKEGDKLGEAIYGVRIIPTAWGTNNKPTAYEYVREKVEDRVWRDCMYWWPIPYSEYVKYQDHDAFYQNPEW